MPIYSENILTRQAAIAGQFSNSGGRIHPTDYVVHGESNNLLPKLTEIDHAGGRVDLAKAYLSIETAAAEQGDDCYTYLDQTADDPLVDVLLVRPQPIGVRAAHTDTRADVQGYIEAYQIPGGYAPWFLRGLHTAGMRQLVLWSRAEVRSPEVGATLYLVANEGAGNEVFQYFQISGFTEEIQTFTTVLPNGVVSTYSRRLMYCALTSALASNFTGPEVAEFDPEVVDLTVRLRETTVADSSRYYGRSALAAGVSAGATAVQVVSVYGQVVPSARGERALAGLDALAAATQTFVSGGVAFSISGPVHTQRIAVTAANRRTTWTRTLLPIPASGGKVRAHVRILDRWYTVVESDSGLVGTLTINRTSGSALLSLTALPDAGSWIIWEWPSGIHFSDRAGTSRIDPIAIPIILPSAAEPETLTISWLSGGVAKAAIESDIGVITGDAVGFRVGGIVGLYFAANLPDGNSSISYSYQPLQTVMETLVPTMTGNYGAVTLADPPRAGSLRLVWSVTRDSAALAKSQSGGVVRKYVSAVGGGTTFTSWGGGSGSWEDSIDLEATETADVTQDTVRRTVSDNGAGGINGDGTINYETGAISLRLQYPHARDKYNVTTITEGDLEYETGQWQSNETTEAIDGPIEVYYALAATIPGAEVTGSIPVPALEVTLLRGIQDQIVPGTVRFTIGTKSYSDRDGNGGILYWADGTVVGTMDYLRRTAVLSQWTGATTVVSVTSLVSTFGQFGLKELSFRTAASPLAPGSLSLLATEVEGGAAVNGTGETDGSLSGTGIESGGIVEHDQGVVALTFSNLVYPGSISYSATAFSIIPLDPAIIGIDPVRLPPDGRVPILRAGDYAVIYEDGVTNLPNPAVGGATYDLDHDGLAYAYLEDGAGEQSYTCPPLTPSSVIQIPLDGRTGALEYAVLEDAAARPVNGALYDVDLATGEMTLPATFSDDGYDTPFVLRWLALAPTAAYTVDRDAGLITMAASPVLTGYTQPLKARWRMHDLSMVVEAQTTGTVTLQSALSHDFTTAAGISALLLHGDLVARVANLFEQNTDDGIWLDYLSGAAPTGGGRFNSTDYPVIVTNNGTIRERWRIKKRSDGQWDVIGETLGVIGIWNGSSTLHAKRISSQANPYFSIYYEGLGTGWSTGNFFQFETWASQGPFWVLRTVRPGRATIATDALRLRHRVGAD